MEPFQAGRMQPRHFHPRNRAHALRAPQRETTSTYQHHIAFTRLEVLGALSGFEILWKNCFTGLDPFNLPDARNIEQDTSADYAVARHINCALMRTLEVNLGVIKAVVHLALIKVMA